MMESYIAGKIMEARDNGGIEAGRAKYRAYFVRASVARLYKKYKDGVEAILEADGYEDCIVTA